MECENCGRKVRDSLEHWSRGYEKWFCSPHQKRTAESQNSEAEVKKCPKCQTELEISYAIGVPDYCRKCGENVY